VYTQLIKLEYHGGAARGEAGRTWERERSLTGTRESWRERDRERERERERERGRERETGRKAEGGRADRLKSGERKAERAKLNGEMRRERKAEVGRRECALPAEGQRASEGERERESEREGQKDALLSVLWAANVICSLDMQSQRFSHQRLATINSATRAATLLDSSRARRNPPKRGLPGNSVNRA